VRLLFDEQLSEELISALRDLFPDVRTLGKGGATDPNIWELAREHGCVLVTKDEDFHRLSVLRGTPPKVVWRRVGNCATADLAAPLRDHAREIQEFEAQTEVAFLELG
jgi:predicted nuclease of predicted toxin-antitoxin system